MGLAEKNDQLRQWVQVKLAHRQVRYYAKPAIYLMSKKRDVMNETVRQALQQAHLYSDRVDYSIIKLPPRAITVAAGIIGNRRGFLCADRG